MIYISNQSDGKYETPKLFSEAISTVGNELNSYILLDESFLVFSGYSREDGLGIGDLYISYRSALGNWSKAKRMEKGINSLSIDYCPFYHLKEGRIYFTSRRSIDAETIISHNLV